MGLKDPAKNYETRTFLQWFDHYLGGVSPKTTLDVTYWRDWVQYKGDATPAYGEAAAYPFGATQRLFLSGSDSLVADAASVQAGSASFSTPSAGVPASYKQPSSLDQDHPV